MKKTLNILGAVALGAAVLFGANSCNNAQNNETAATQTPDSTCVAGAPAGSIVFSDMTRVMAEYKMAVDLSAEVEKKVAELEKNFTTKKTAAEKEITRKQNNLKTKADDFQDKYSKGHLTESAANAKVQEIQKLEQELNTYGATKEQELAQEGAKVQAQINDELVVMNNKVNDAINTFIQSYRAEKGYAMIIANQSDVDTTDKAHLLSTPILSADPSLDVTSDVIAGLNAAYTPAK